MSIKETLIFSKSALEIVTDPFIIGDELLHLAKESSKDFLHVLDIDRLEQPFTCLNILRGGRYYCLIDAWDEVVIQDQNKDYQLALSEIRASRGCDKDGNWYCKVWHDHTVSNISDHESETNLLNAKTLIIGDTIATGTTIINVLKWFVDFREKNNMNNPIKIILYAICGSSIAKHVLYKFYKEQLESNNIEIELYLANAAYVLHEVNGTDLSLITDSILPEAEQYIENKVGVTFLKHMKCAIWDWGDRFNGIEHHLKEIIQYFSTFYIYDLPEYIRQSLVKYQSNMLHSKL
eukprot:337727_1